jgi:hypothetical protein
MSDHEFEKQVQQKMDELKFRPTDAVWAGVEKNIRRDKRRRRALIWFPLTFLLLATGGYVLYTGAADGTVVASQHKQATGNNSEEKRASVEKQQTEQSQSKEGSSVDKHQSIVTNDQNTTLHKEQDVKNAQQHIMKEQPQRVRHDVAAAQGNKQIAVNKPQGNIRNNKLSPESIVTIPVEKEEAIDQNSIKEKPAQLAIESIKEEKQQTEETVVMQEEPAAREPGQAVDSVNEAANTVALNEKVREAVKTDSTDELAKDKPPALVTPEKNSKWQWGIHAGVGISNVAEGGLANLLQKARVEDLSYAGRPQLNGLNYSININPPPVLHQSSIDAGPAFSVGGFVQRTLSKRLSLSAGLQYSYFGLRTSVGDLVKNSFTVNFGALDSRVVESYYSGGQLSAYTNNYHFIELPVLLHWQLNRSSRLPIVFDGGITLSRLVSTNALHYDGSSGVYYEDNSLYNKMQLGLTTGLNVGFFQRSKTPVYIGPDIHYFMTGLVKKKVSNGQYLWSTGISVKMLLKK